MRLAVLMIAGMTACTPVLVSQSPPSQNVAAMNAGGSILVKFEKQSGEVLHFAIMNNTDKMLVVNRDAVILQTPRGAVARDPGGLKSVYQLKPGKLHGLKVRFPIADLLDDEQVEVLFTDALLIDGQAVVVEPVRFIVGE